MFMPILFAVMGTPLGCFAEGAILGASVYLVSRGVRNPLKNKKKYESNECASVPVPPSLPFLRRKGR